ncbi:uncharacterized protein A1O9_11874 [Exophiala aquamarina CBS 119918]|uniref:RING-type domain-containing protein n=1 Tax=Exophiala aquamarina CBS 119918 TaxID=1182545 RepID=A0A072P8K0_9EURO|nr:uncharacterized protein A1O9_11874 [Exophiala aquamarina CBS 119918]KEF51885.1 hypothetical protein A1O9_11874 [Exophiala aquamarina CBS 119918]
MSDHGSLSSQWIFLITVFAISLAVGVLTLVVQHRQRTLLSLRIANGEVDLEALGIKRLHIPQDLVEKLPKYTYTSGSEGAPATANEAPVRQVLFPQPTCPICLDNFIHNESTIRELPCRHIFHPRCIDLFLSGNSSLCPMCKRSAFPRGYCPVNVTNLMVRQERLMRRARQQIHEASPSPIPAMGASQSHIGGSSASSAPTATIYNSPGYGHGACTGDADVINVTDASDRTIIRPATTVYYSKKGDTGTTTAESQKQPQTQDTNIDEVSTKMN